MIEVNRNSDKNRISEILSSETLDISYKFFGTNFKITKTDTNVFLSKKNGQQIVLLDKVVSPHFRKISEWFDNEDFSVYHNGVHSKTLLSDGSIVGDHIFVTDLSEESKDFLSNKQTRKFVDGLNIDKDVMCVFIRSNNGALKVKNYKFNHPKRSEITDAYKSLYADILKNIELDEVRKVILTSFQTDHLYFILMNRIYDHYTKISTGFPYSDLVGNMPRGVMDEEHINKVRDLLGSDLCIFDSNSDFAIYFTILSMFREDKIMKNNSYITDDLISKYDDIITFRNNFIANPLVNSSTPSYSDFSNK